MGVLNVTPDSFSDGGRFSGVDEAVAAGVELAQEGMTMMVVTHEMGFARKVAHRVIFMDHGRIAEDASKEDFFAAPRSPRAQAFLAKILGH